MTPRERTLQLIRGRTLLMAGRLRPRRRMPRQLQPDRIREFYLARLRVRVLAPARELLERTVFPKLEALLERSRRTDVRLDSINDDMDAASEAFFRTILRPADLEDLIGDVADRTSAFQKDQLARQLEASVGVDVMSAEPGLAPRAAEFTADNVALIKSVPNQYFDAIEKTITRAMAQGLRHEELAKQLAERFGVADSQAALIARDQVGKYFGELQRVRQTALGIEAYIWRTVNDNRVREEHAALEGERFLWSDPPPDGQPGQAINCRCYAEPDLKDLLGV